MVVQYQQKQKTQADNNNMGKGDGFEGIGAKSEASLEMGQEQKGNSGKFDIEKSGRSVANMSEKDVGDIQRSFMRKIRNLQVRIKNINLNNETTLYKQTK